MKRIGNAFKGVLGGLVLIVIGVILLWWNEGNNVKNIKTTDEMKASYVDVTSEMIDSTNEGKLIATNGKLIYNGEVSDVTFDVKVDSPLLKRVVEVYQWEEESSTDEDGNTTYTYNKVWKDYIIDSSEFHEEGHYNTFALPFNNETITADEVYVGAFKLTQEQVERLSTKGVVRDFNTERVLELDYTINDQYLTTSTDVNNPQIGDSRISFEYHDATELSVLAVQRGDGFEDYVSSVGKTVSKMVDGKYSGEQLVSIVEKENKILKWVLRLVGTLLCIFGVLAVLKPISAVSSYIPILGNIVGFAVGLVSFLIGLSISLIVIAIAWIRFRPIIGISLLAIVAVLIVILIIRPKGKKAENVTPLEPATQTEPVTVAQEQVAQQTQVVPEQVNIQNVVEPSVQTAPVQQPVVTPSTLDGFDAQVPEQVVAPTSESVIQEPVQPVVVPPVTPEPVAPAVVEQNVQIAPVEQTPAQSEQQVVQVEQNNSNNQM